jgi:hypothetical protein
MQPTQCSETSAFNTHTPGKYTEDILYLQQHGKSLKTRSSKLSAFYNYKGNARNKYRKHFVRSEVFNIRWKFFLTERGCGFEKVLVHWKCVDWRLELDTRDNSHLQNVQIWRTLDTSLCVYSQPFKNQPRRPFKTSNFAVKLVGKIVLYVRTVNL